MTHKIPFEESLMSIPERLREAADKPAEERLELLQQFKKESAWRVRALRNTEKVVDLDYKFVCHLVNLLAPLNYFRPANELEVFPGEENAISIEGERFNYPITLEDLGVLCSRDSDRDPAPDYFRPKHHGELATIIEKRLSEGRNKMIGENQSPLSLRESIGDSAYQSLTRVLDQEYASLEQGD